MIAPYSILGVPQTATKEQIKRAYKKLSLVYHPDMPTGNKDKFIQIKSAYEELMVIDPTKVHQQYEHRHKPSTSFNRVYIDKDGDCVIDISIRNINYIESIGALDGLYHWKVFGMTNGLLGIKKEDLIKCGYTFSLKFVPVIGHSATKEFKFDVPRTKWQKFIDKMKVKFNIYLP